MNTLLSLIFLAVGFAVDIVLEKKPNLTTNCYRKTEVSLSFTQNRFLKLPQKPVCSSYGFDPVRVSVPYSIDTFVWEVSGFFTPDKMGLYSFSIPMATNASIEIKETKLQQQGTEQTFPNEYESILNHTEAFGSCSVSLRFIDRRHYYIKIVYIAGTARVPIYVTDPAGIQQALESMIEEAVYDPRVRSQTFPSLPSRNFMTPSFYQQVGFFSMVFFLPKELKNLKNVLRDYKNLEKVDEGYFQTRGPSVKLQSRSIPYIREILGHFRAPLDGKYRVKLSGTGVVAVQIGPKQLVKDVFYVVNDEWKLLDTRSVCTIEVELEKTFFYPFRIVSLNNEENYHLDISVLNSEGKSIDLFGIWKDL